MAQRQSTPNKALSRSNTPMRNAGIAQEPKVEVDKSESGQQTELSSDFLGLETLFAKGRAAAEAKMKEQAASIASPSPAQEQKVPTTHEQPPQTKQQTPKLTEQTEPPQTNAPTQSEPAESTWSTKLTDAYYSDLSIWLEMTGYHDVEYRNSKLQTYKERKALEAEMARLQERMNKLKEADQANIAALRSAVVHPTTAAAPALPTMMPNEDLNTVAQQIATPSTANNKAIGPITNGIKRAHSPEPIQVSKARRDNQQTNFRIRGANDSPTTSGARGRPRSPGAAGIGLERRISYPDARRVSLDGYDRRATNVRNGTGSRDPSLERRQAYYKREAEQPALAQTYNNRDRYDRDVMARPGYENRGRLGYSNVNDLAHGDVGGRRYADYPQSYRGSAGLDLRKGGKKDLFR